MIYLFLVQVSAYCDCQDISDQTTCDNFESNCQWKNGKCQKIDCYLVGTHESRCSYPDCYYNPFAQRCEDFHDCSQVIQNCYSHPYCYYENSANCAPFEVCSDIDPQFQCTNLIQISNGSRCHVNSTGQCDEISLKDLCQSTKLKQECLAFRDCRWNDDQNSCYLLKCSSLPKGECNYKRCAWIDNCKDCFYLYGKMIMFSLLILW
ncbi:hypothetical protein pb186bvf_017035 [Paramecium bursaria]